MGVRQNGKQLEEGNTVQKVKLLNCLDAHWFATLAEAKQVIQDWRREYNQSRPHRALGERTPNEFAGQFAARRELTSLQAAENSPCG